MIIVDFMLISFGVVMTCMALTRWRRDLTELHIKVNFMEIREQHRAEEVIQYRHEIWRVVEELKRINRA